MSSMQQDRVFDLLKFIRLKPVSISEICTELEWTEKAARAWMAGLVAHGIADVSPAYRCGRGPDPALFVLAAAWGGPQ